jgi:hypothetical protein
MSTDDTHTRRQPAPPSPPRPTSPAGGIDLPTLAIAAIASVVAATVVSHFWGAGTIIATALTPVIVAVVKEGLARPAQRITEVSAKGPSAAAKILGARHEAEGPVVVAGEYEPHDDEVGEYRVYGRPRERRRRAWKVAIVTGLLAFVVAAAVMTLPELVAGRSIFNSGKETTLFRGTRHRSTSTTTTPKTTPSVTETTVTTVTRTTTTPAQTTTTPTTTPTTPAQTQTTPAQTTTTPPPAATTPAQTTPAPVP